MAVTVYPPSWDGMVIAPDVDDGMAVLDVGSDVAYSGMPPMVAFLFETVYCHTTPFTF